MRETDFWQRLEHHLGGAYARVWAEQTHIADLGDRTVADAVRAGVPCKQVWRAVHAQLELPMSDR